MCHRIWWRIDLMIFILVRIVEWAPQPLELHFRESTSHRLSMKLASVGPEQSAVKKFRVHSLCQLFVFRS